ncbi:MAG: hypothetical protein LBP92_00045 [Deltaproteobacteria bacterium]|nr:hypothetical protein [Deltaproteobacteria bacterium]
MAHLASRARTGLGAAPVTHSQAMARTHADEILARGKAGPWQANGWPSQPEGDAEWPDAPDPGNMGCGGAKGLAR